MSAYNLNRLIIVLFLMIDPSSANQQHTNIVIVGGTGDLARKYLWNSALDLFFNNYNENTTFSFYAGARVSPEDGTKALNDILDHIICELGDIKCTRLRPKFIENSKYVILKSAEHYNNLCNSFKTLPEELDIPDLTVRQIFYFSIPSSAYESVARLVNENCRNEGVSTQVVLEKPFGLDKHSAETQVKAISKHFSDDEVHRVDHYLAKPVSKQILNFRNTNKEKLEELLNAQYVDRVEIVMKEQIGCKGRIDFYDQTGVVRDVMQNHLTELLALVAMDLPSNITDSALIEQHKLQLLRQTKPGGKKSLITGQYSKYMAQAKEEIEDTSQSYLTPTFAAAVLRIESPRWRNVPFVIMSGKHMDERSSFVRILFREREFCVSGCAGGNSTFTKYPRQVIYQIGHGPIPTAGILVSRSLFEPDWPIGMRELPITSKDSTIHGQSPGDFYYGVPIKDDQAYVTVLHDLYHSVKETFVTASRVLVLWDIWDEIISDSKHTVPIKYKEYNGHNLNFSVGLESIRFIHSHKGHNVDVEEDLDFLTLPGLFRNHSLVCKKTQELLDQLVSHITQSALKAIKDRNVFHIAFSGGKTPKSLFRKLVKNAPLLPWEQIHVWQVDERCVSYKHDQSNFRSLYDDLLQHVPIPYFNIHPMPVEVAGRICDNQDKGDNLYEDLISHLIPDQKFDFILLGLGNDGHTASIFPHSPELEADSLVSLTTSVSKDSKNRMTLLLPLINKAREASVLVTGKGKHSVLHQLSYVGLNEKSLPISYVNLTDGDLTWYIDLDAWIG